MKITVEFDEPTIAVAQLNCCYKSTVSVHKGGSCADVERVKSITFSGIEPGDGLGSYLLAIIIGADEIGHVWNTPGTHVTSYTYPLVVPDTLAVGSKIKVWKLPKGEDEPTPQA